ncbi:MAG: hypothetical protein OI715_00395 (plasmid) [Candidatus Methanoperedens sp.]|nr:MAG: hypothetical protein OI715_00395 [Candidatus Methanoperedens sp.]
MKRKNLKYIVNILTILAFFLFIGINIPYEISVPYTDTEIYTVEEPYIDLNYYNYTVTEPYIEEVPIDYIVLDAQYTNYVHSPPSYLWVIIKNNDTIGGNFNVDFHITDMGGAFPSLTTISSSGNYISSGETKTVKISYNESIREFKYDIIPPTKEVTKYKNIPMQKTETKYRIVQKSREVIKFRNESTTILQRILIWEVGGSLSLLL